MGDPRHSDARELLVRLEREALERARGTRRHLATELANDPVAMKPVHWIQEHPKTSLATALGAGFLAAPSRRRRREHRRADGDSRPLTARAASWFFIATRAVDALARLSDSAKGGPRGGAPSANGEEAR